MNWTRGSPKQQHCPAAALRSKLGGSLTRQVEQDCPVSEASPHIANIGRLVEDMENKIRNTLNEIYFGKTRDIVNGLRSVEPLSDANKKQALQVGDSQDDPQPKHS